MAYPCGNRCIGDVIIRLSSNQFRLLILTFTIGSMICLSHLITTVYLYTSASSTSVCSKRMAQTSTMPFPKVTPFSMSFVTISDQEKAQDLAKLIVENKLAACVNIVPKILSVYEWKGKIVNDNESLMIVKTRTSRVEELTEFIRKNHPYEVCEVISTPIQQGNPAYLEWLGKNVADKAEETSSCG